MSNTIQIAGEVIGEAVPDPESGEVLIRIVRIQEEQRPAGPATNSILLVERSRAGRQRVRYLPWVGYADLDQLSALDFGKWRIIEPAVPFEEEAEWVPYGWAPLSDALVRLG